MDSYVGTRQIGRGNGYLKTCIHTCSFVFAALCLELASCFWVMLKSHPVKKLLHKFLYFPAFTFRWVYCSWKEAPILCESTRLSHMQYAAWLHSIVVIQDLVQAHSCVGGSKRNHCTILQYYTGGGSRRMFWLKSLFQLLTESQNLQYCWLKFLFEYWHMYLLLRYIRTWDTLTVTCSKRVPTQIKSIWMEFQTIRLGQIAVEPA